MNTLLNSDTCVILLHHVTDVYFTITNDRIVLVPSHEYYRSPITEHSSGSDQVPTDDVPYQFSNRSVATIKQRVLVTNWVLPVTMDNDPTYKPFCMAYKLSA